MLVSELVSTWAPYANGINCCGENYLIAAEICDSDGVHHYSLSLGNGAFMTGVIQKEGENTPLKCMSFSAFGEEAKELLDANSDTNFWDVLDAPYFKDILHSDKLEPGTFSVFLAGESEFSYMYHDGVMYEGDEINIDFPDEEQKVEISEGSLMAFFQEDPNNVQALFDPDFFGSNLSLEPVDIDQMLSDLED